MYKNKKNAQKEDDEKFKLYKKCGKNDYKSLIITTYQSKLETRATTSLLE